MNDNRKPGLFQRKQDQMIIQLHAAVMEGVIHWRHVADSEEANEGDLRDGLRQTANVLERMVESHRVQHDIIVHLRRSAFASWAIIALWSIAFIVELFV